MKAVDKFEYRRGYKFSTYATGDPGRLEFQVHDEGTLMQTLGTHLLPTKGALYAHDRTINKTFGPRARCATRSAASDAGGTRRKSRMPLEKGAKGFSSCPQEHLFARDANRRRERRNSHLGDFTRTRTDPPIDVGDPV